MILDNLKAPGPAPSRLAIGCEPLGGVDWGEVNLDQARQAVSHAWERGITVFDTADVYGLGASERALSEALGAHRHEAFIVSKFGVRWEQQASARATTFRDSSPAYLETALEDSLRRLRIDAIPLYLVHWPDPNTPLPETLAFLEKLQEQGKILNFGLSNFDEAVVAELTKAHRIAAIQAGFNLIDRKERSNLENAARNGVSRITYGTLAQGLLTGKYDRETEFGSKDRRSRLPHFRKEAWDKVDGLLLRLNDVARRHQRPSSEVAIRWVLDCGAADCAIVGAKSPLQVDLNISALEWRLSPEDIELLSEDTLSSPA